MVAASEPIDPRARLAIAQWPDDAPRGAVSTFCAEHDISRKSFYELRRRAEAEGPAAVLEPRSRRPRSSPAKLTDAVKAKAVQVRAALEASGLDHGPISVHDKMQAMGLEVVPSVASLARIFRQPHTAWDATQKVEAPRPKPDPPLFVPAATRRLRRAPAPEDLPAGTSVRKLTSAGTFMLAGVHYMVGGQHGLQQVLVIVDGDKITVADQEGEILIEHTRPTPGVT